MKDSCRFSIYIIISLFLTFSSGYAQDVKSDMFTVVIDPGHGGKDPGAVYKQIKEKDIVLDIGLKLGEYITKNLKGVKVIYTRSTDKFVPLYRRAEIANKNKANLFISLHANYCGTPSIYGTETFILGLHRTEENLEVAKKENSVIQLEDDYSIHYEGFDNSSESYIIFEMVQGDYLEQSVNLAGYIQNQFKTRAGRKDRSVKQAGFLVLRRTSMPSVLVEAGFLSNPSEAKYMTSDKGQAILASAIFRAVREYKNDFEAKSSYKLNTQVKTADKVESPKEDSYITKEKKVKGIYFSVQLSASSKKIDASSVNFHGLHPVHRKKEGSIFKYFYGKEKSYQQIQELKNIAKRNFPDAFIVAFENDTPVSLKKALRKIKP